MPNDLEHDQIRDEWFAFETNAILRPSARSLFLLDNENKRLIERNRKLTAELARALGLDDKQREQMELSLLHELEKTREEIFRCDEHKDEQAEGDQEEKKKKKKRKGHGPRPQRQLPLVELPAHELAEENRGCNVCRGTVDEMKGQFEESKWVTVVHRDFRREVACGLSRRRRWLSTG